MNPVPGAPVGPVDPVQPVDPVGPVDPVRPVDPVGPVDPDQPVNPVGPVNPVDPVRPVGPVNPVGPDTVEPQTTFVIVFPGVSPHSRPMMSELNDTGGEVSESTPFLYSLMLYPSYAMPYTSVVRVVLYSVSPDPIE